MTAPKPNSLLWLWQRYNKSGFDGEPVITNVELALLRDKMTEVAEFLSSNNPAVWSLRQNVESINHMIEVRKEP
jgi:hypothetical protein